MMQTRTVIYFFLLASYLIGTSCESTRRTSSLKRQYKEIYINQFKLTYFRQLLIKSYNNSSAVREIIYTDHSGFTEPILNKNDYTLIDSLTTLDNQRLVADSIEGHRRAEGAEGKRPLSLVMDKLSSKWLDSLAKRQLKLNGIPSHWID
ncbi:MAG: hypothetical protein LCH58_13170 [Bacteroidetes bacterium]|uniref:hypothetical protein n=1 Tax=Phnomibacter sp. TaxID=2836217 RepID=UPI002FDEDD32|nr:hypothetical protein [Bacteroidota bacterium]